jgi:hypothetical protein
VVLAKVMNKGAREMKGRRKEREKENSCFSIPLKAYVYNSNISDKIPNIYHHNFPKPKEVSFVNKIKITG